MVYEYDMYGPYQYQSFYSYPYGPYPYLDYYAPPYAGYSMPYYSNAMMPPIPYDDYDVIRQPNAVNSPTNQQVNSMMQQFLNEHGQVDIQKMLQTVGQLADTVQQVTPVVRQLNDLIRAFRA